MDRCQFCMQVENHHPACPYDKSVDTKEVEDWTDGYVTATTTRAFRENPSPEWRLGWNIGMQADKENQKLGQP